MLCYPLGSVLPEARDVIISFQNFRQGMKQPVIHCFQFPFQLISSSPLKGTQVMSCPCLTTQVTLGRKMLLNSILHPLLPHLLHPRTSAPCCSLRAQVTDDPGQILCNSKENQFPFKHLSLRIELKGTAI
jgi:hypothetical protein